MNIIRHHKREKTNAWYLAIGLTRRFLTSLEIISLVPKFEAELLSPVLRLNADDTVPVEVAIDSALHIDSLVTIAAYLMSQGCLSVIGE